MRSLVFAISAVATFVGACIAAEPAPVRVVSQTVGTDEMLVALANPEQIAALSHRSREVEFSAVAGEAKKFPILTEGDAETVLRHSPALALFADYSRAELVAQVRRAGVRVLIFDRYETLGDAYANLRTLARELGAEERAEKLIAHCETRVAELQRRLDGVKPVRVIAPSVYGLIGGARTTFQDLCDHAAAENLATTLGGLTGHAPTPSEKILTWPVDVVVVCGANLDEALAPFRTMPPFQFMPAIKERRAVLLRSNLLSSVSHHRIEGYEELARALHPEVFR